MLDYQNLINDNLTVYDEFVNSIGQRITFVEDPMKGDEVQIICISHELQLAAYSDFFDLDDMLASHGEYEPLFINGNFRHGM